MAQQQIAVSVAGMLGVTFSALFVGANLGISYIAVPALLLPSPPSALPSPANAHNAASPTSTSSEKPATKPPHLARQWQDIFRMGSKAGPVAALLSSASFLYAFRRLPSGARLQQRLFIAAATSSLAIVPFTFGVMKRTNDELHRRANAATRGEEEESKAEAKEGSVESYQTPDLVRWWASLNFLRALLHVGSIGCAIAAMNL